MPVVIALRSIKAKFIVCPHLGQMCTLTEQKRIAEDTIADVNASELWPGKVVTEVAPADAFWEAEPEHQDYLERIPNGIPAISSGRTGIFPDELPESLIGSL